MQVTITIPDELAARAIANGSTPEVWPRPRTREELNASLDRLDFTRFEDITAVHPATIDSHLTSLPLHPS